MTGTALHQDSLAWNALADGDKAEQVSAEVWFPELSETHRYAVHEDVRHLEAYGLALSLIVVHED
ncbi:MAG: hypothetical protein ACR2HJ_07815 [Fimbriimonadales bacterium]